MTTESFTRPGVDADMLAEKLSAKLRAHSAFAELKRFGQLAHLQPMTPPQLEQFFGSLWTFFEEVPTGILALSLNICDQLRLGATWSATALAARVLTANVDEFGLRRPGDSTHHQLFAQLIQRLGLSGEQLKRSRRIFGSAYRLANTTRLLYRSPDVLAGIGLHLASELTSSVEFGHFDTSFRKHASAYGIRLDTQDDPFVFFHVHTEVEPEHYANAVALALEIASTSRDDSYDGRILAGATAFLNDFGDLFADFNRMLEEGRAH
ncbi:MAG TPA: iron-containing redox enzyme family protein [Burkholderiaceae bacterium]|nr:iron-containing redox enzyme family protein [Burkholderiaceae bacterium]